MSATFGYLAALLATNLRAAFSNPLQAVSQLALMVLNNLIFLLVWVLYFERFPELRGWGRADVAMLYGVTAFGFGLMVALAGGMRDLARTIVDGSLDVHLGRPRHPLPSLLMSRSVPAGFGDVASAFVIWLWFAERSVSDLPLLVLLSLAAGTVMTATTTAAQCVVFWWPGVLRLAEQFWEVILMITIYPQHVFGPAIRLVLFTVLPVAFMSQVPVEAIREGDPLKMLAVVLAAFVYGALAIAIFDRGLRRYQSGNQMVVNR